MEISTTNARLDVLVAHLDITPRTRNALHKAGIKTVRDLIQKSERDLRGIRGIGRHTVQEVKTVLADMQLCLGMSLY